MICLHCGATVDPIGSMWVHRSAVDAVLCEWIRGLREDDDPVVLEQLQGLFNDRPG